MVSTPAAFNPKTLINVGHFCTITTDKFEEEFAESELLPKVVKGSVVYIAGARPFHVTKKIHTTSVLSFSVISLTIISMWMPLDSGSWTPSLSNV